MKNEKTNSNSVNLPTHMSVNFEKFPGTLEIYRHGAIQPDYKCLLDSGLVLNLAIRLHDAIVNSSECKSDGQYQAYREKCKEIE